MDRKKNLCIPTIWDNEFLYELKKRGLHKNIFEIYGSLPVSVIGSGRPSTSLPKVDVDHVEEHINIAHSMGIKFNFLINAPCLGLREFDPKYHNKIIKFLDWINSCKVDTVSVAVPYLLEIIKDHFPRLKVKVSVFASINSVQSAMFWEELGADRLTLDLAINRDFKLIKKIKESTKCDIEVITNNLCLYQCPYRFYHSNIVGHASQNDVSEIAIKMFDSLNYPMIKCSLKMLTNLSELIKARWIRPEDLEIYQKFGVDFFKIEGRTRNKVFILLSATAYSQRKYDGNLLDIVRLHPCSENSSLRKSIDYYHDPPIYIDNTKLEGFILPFIKGMRCEEGCNKCKYCDKICSDIVYIIDEERRKKCLEKLKKLEKVMVRMSKILNSHAIEKSYPYF